MIEIRKEEPASRHKLHSQWEGVSGEAFVIVVFDGNSLPKAGGIARYRSEFDEAMELTNTLPGYFTC